MTFMPALPSSAARIPPAAPAPTMTTSVFSVAMAWTSALRLGLQAGHGEPRECRLALHVGRREGRLRSREADEAPAREVLVAAIDRVGEHALDRVRAQRVEEGLLARPGEARGLARFKRRDHLVLLRGAQLGKRLAVRLAAIFIERREPAAIEILQIRIGAGEREIDVV